MLHAVLYELPNGCHEADSIRALMDPLRHVLDEAGLDAVLTVLESTAPGPCPAAPENMPRFVTKQPALAQLGGLL